MLLKLKAISAAAHTQQPLLISCSVVTVIVLSHLLDSMMYGDFNSRHRCVTQSTDVPHEISIQQAAVFPCIISTLLCTDDLGFRNLVISVLALEVAFMLLFRGVPVKNFSLSVQL